MSDLDSFITYQNPKHDANSITSPKNIQTNVVKAREAQVKGFEKK